MYSTVKLHYVIIIDVFFYVFKYVLYTSIVYTLSMERKSRSVKVYQQTYLHCTNAKEIC